MAELIAAQNLAVLYKDCCGGQTLVATQQGKRRRAHAPPIAILAAPAADHRRDVRRELDRRVTQLPSYVAGMVGGRAPRGAGGEADISRADVDADVDRC